MSIVPIEVVVNALFSEEDLEKLRGSGLDNITILRAVEHGEIPDDLPENIKEILRSEETTKIVIDVKPDMTGEDIAKLVKEALK